MSNNGDGSGRGQAALVQSVDRAVSVLEILARRGEVGVTDLAAELGVHKSTAFRLVVVLENRGLVEQTVDRGKYRLGFGIVRLAGATAVQLDLSRESRAVCERLAAELGETVNVAILDAGYAINISQVRGNAAVSSHNWVGQRTPLHATSSGKVLLAFQPLPVRDDLIARGLTRYTPQTITDPAELRDELGEVSRRGWAATSEELEIGLNAVAAPIRGQDGEVVAAVSVSGPSYRLDADSFAKIAEPVVAGAVEISARIGHLG
jgi:IclR family transcriptional regulator, acetate operon repressor